MRILLDNGILSHSEFLVPAVQIKEIKWGSCIDKTPVHGYVRKPQSENLVQQNEIDGIYTLGRLIRESKIHAFTSIEIINERWRGRSPFPEFNALNGCAIQSVPAPIERTKFRKTIDFRKYISKDKDKDNEDEFDVSQIGFFNWLCELKKIHVSMILNHRDKIGLTNFEVDSFDDLNRFHFLCRRLQSKKNYPDAFHLWTAERNDLDYLVTLDQKLINAFLSIKREKQKKYDFTVDVVPPSEILKVAGIKSFDFIPVEYGRFYNIFETRKAEQDGI